MGIDQYSHRRLPHQEVDAAVGVTPFIVVPVAGLDEAVVDE